MTKRSRCSELSAPLLWKRHRWDSMTPSSATSATAAHNDSSLKTQRLLKLVEANHEGKNDAGYTSYRCLQGHRLERAAREPEVGGCRWTREGVRPDRCVARSGR